MSYTERKLQPFGLELQVNGALPALPSLLEQVRRHKILLIREAEQLDRSAFLNYCQQQAELVRWELGAVMEMKVDANTEN